MRRIALLATLITIPLALSAQTPSDPPQDPDITAVVEGARVKAQERLAFPGLERINLSSAASRAADELDAALRSDLLATGIFALQGPEELAVLELTGDQERDVELYRSLGNEVLLTGQVSEMPDGVVVLESRLWDLSSGQSILGKRYRGGPELARRIAHTYADEIVLFFTGRRGIALTSIAFYSDRNGFKEVYLMDFDGHDQRAITGHQSISLAPDWKPQGDRIAYASMYKGEWNLYAVDLEDGEKKPLVTEGTFNSSPAYSPDGAEIAFTRSRGGGNTEIFVADADGQNARQVTRSAGLDTNPAWSPDGTKIAFTSDRAGNPHLYMMDAGGGNVTRLTFEGNYNDGAAWSPDGTRVTYATRNNRTAGFQIAVTDVTTLETKILTAWSGSHEAPSFSPDGRWIVFTTEKAHNRQIYAMDINGRGVRQLTSEGNNYAPDWSPYP